MDFIPQDKILKVNPDTLDVVRKEINMDKPGEMKQAVNIVKEWIQQQPHLRKKDFTDHYIEIAIVTSKGSIERAKKQIDTACTMRTLMPQFFGVTSMEKDFTNLVDAGYLVIMPKLSKQNHRIMVLQITGPPPDSTIFMKFFKYSFFFAEYLKAHDYVSNYECIIDMRLASLPDILSSMNPMELKQALTIIVDCYGMRIKSIHMITSSKLIETFISILKQLLKPKMVQRLHHHNDCDEIIKTFGKEYLPEELGGTEGSVKDLRDKWLETLFSKENMEYTQEMNRALTDENCRPRGKFNEEYAGMPGTFRVLSVD
ncbi:alpha-tocopherol transfer protein-like [Zerene cesonia]|uniref:alpha-tocopherol transfer protein-like n=1 Tax=Zerene cesonia TaxID=33412 RepID=UPI0018E59579|nr:alpha-tocopherol transfer protein-like [Zerene cesonia]